MIASPGRTSAGRISLRSTTPTAKPTRSNSPGSRIPGCSDLSTPMSAPPAACQPRATPPARDAGHDLADLLRHELAHRDVVEEEQGLGAVRGDVVDGHRNTVD